MPVWRLQHSAGTVHVPPENDRSMFYICKAAKLATQNMGRLAQQRFQNTKVHAVPEFNDGSTAYQITGYTKGDVDPKLLCELAEAIVHTVPGIDHHKQIQFRKGPGSIILRIPANTKARSIPEGLVWSTLTFVSLTCLKFYAVDAWGI